MVLFMYLVILTEWHFCSRETNEVDFWQIILAVICLASCALFKRRIEVSDLEPCLKNFHIQLEDRLSYSCEDLGFCDFYLSHSCIFLQEIKLGFSNFVHHIFGSTKNHPKILRTNHWSYRNIHCHTSKFIHYKSHYKRYLAFHSFKANYFFSLLLKQHTFTPNSL